MEEQTFVVLLYYHYVYIDDTVSVQRWQLDICEKYGINGRIRISSEGLNGTLSGEQDSIRSYIEEFQMKSELRPQEIHWKISGLNPHQSYDSQKFADLRVQITREVVSLDLNENEQKLLIQTKSANHLNAQEFHDAITEASSSNSPLVILDVRNFYEIEIGKFEYYQSDGRLVSAIDPGTRTFSDFKHFVRSHKSQLQDKHVFMYCTGGVRCERASAYLKMNGVHNLNQLHGGIHSYQEAFPEGGYFKGKNFVYDPRISVPYKHKDEVVGACRLCKIPYDDYSSKTRCKKCRVLQLVCNGCRDNHSTFKENGILCKMCEPQEENVTNDFNVG